MTHFKTILQVILANKAAGLHFFEKEAMPFFNRQLYGANLIGGRYFITSERMDRSMPRRFTIRKAERDGHVTTVGEFQQYATLQDAKDAAKKLLKMREGVPSNPVKEGHTKDVISRNRSPRDRA